MRTVLSLDTRPDGCCSDWTAPPHPPPAPPSLPPYFYHSHPLHPCPNGLTGKLLCCTQERANHFTSLGVSLPFWKMGMRALEESLLAFGEFVPVEAGLKGGPCLLM